MNIMLDPADLKPVFFAPFVSSAMRVEPDWIDYNGHLNMAYYNVLFDRAADEVLALIGAGLDYVTLERHSYYTAETHLRYLRELKAGDAVRATFQLLDHDAKRLHYFEQLVHATEGWVAATLEVMALHVDMDAGRAAPAPPVIATRLAEMKASHAMLPRPEAAGRRVAMPERV
jgi:acyl-CoA thioester hydrolase